MVLGFVGRVKPGVKELKYFDIVVRRTIPPVRVILIIVVLLSRFEGCARLDN